MMDADKPLVCRCPSCGAPKLRPITKADPILAFFYAGCTVCLTIVVCHARSAS